MTTKILIVYATQYGNTKKMAERVAKGAKAVENTEVTVTNAEEAKIEETAATDALILGSPVHMGSPDWRMKKYIDTVCSKLWMQDKMNGKVGAVFSTGGGYGNCGGGCELTLLAMMNNLAELGLIIVPLPKNTKGYETGGIQWGPNGRTMGLHMENTGIQEEHMLAAESHGRHVARLAGIVKGKKVFGE